MTTLSEFRQQYPQYGNRSDQELSDALYQKNYSGMPRDEFNKMIGYTPTVSQGYPAAIGHGLASGAEGLMSLPGGMASLAVSGVQRAAGMMGASPETQEKIGKVRDAIPLATPSQVANFVEGATGYKPLTEEQRQAMPQGEKYAYAGAEMFPGAAAFGIPGGVKGMLSSGLKYGVVPGLGGEAVVQATNAEGSPDEWWIRTLGSVGTAFGAAGAGAMGKWAATKTPDIQPLIDRGLALQNQAKHLYNAVDNSGIRINPISLQALNARVRSAVMRGTREFENLPDVTQKALRDLDTLSQRPLTFTALDEVRQNLRDAVVATEKKSGLYARVMTKQIDDYVRSLQPQDIVSGASPHTTIRSLEQARDLWSRSASFQQKAQIIGDIYDAARDAVGANYTAAGMQTALAQKFRALNAQMRKDEDLRHLFSAAERLAINDIVRGGGTGETLLRKLGGMAPTSMARAGFTTMGTSPIGTGVGLLTGGPVGGAVGSVAAPALAMAIGTPARAAANNLQRQSLDRLIAAALNQGRVVKLPPVSSFNPAMPLAYGLAARPAPSASELAQALSGQPAR